MLVMPFTWSITNGIGAGFVTFAVIKLCRGRGRDLHWMLYLACAAFVVYFCLPMIEGRHQEDASRKSPLFWHYFLTEAWVLDYTLRSALPFLEAVALTIAEAI